MRYTKGKLRLWSDQLKSGMRETFDKKVIDHALKNGPICDKKTASVLCSGLKESEVSLDTDAVRLQHEFIKMVCMQKWLISATLWNY